MVAGQFIPAHAIDRPELRRELDSALVRPLTLVIAQAGSGKSVLLSQWVASHPEVGCAWVDVYETDDDPSAFVERITRALQTTEPAIESADHSGAMGETVLVLDDLHHLTNLRTLDNLRTLLERLPSHIHVVISSRVDFPMTWTKIRLRNDIGEIRQSALAMNHEESAALLTAITGRELDRASISALLDRTEGWAAGLLLAGMTLRLRHDSAKFIAEFTGSDRLVADYLSEEVLDALPPNDRSALLELSVLDHMSAELIAHLAQSPHGADLLARFERQSMFLIPSDNSRESFRFHQLFRDLLRYRLRAEDPTAEARILARAALWHLKRGESGYAIDYFLRARDWDRALAAISPRGAGVFERGDLVAVARWLDAIPESVISDRVDVLLLKGILTGMNGAASKAEDQLRAVAARPMITRGQLACAQTFLAALVQWRPRPAASIVYADRALATIDALGDSPTPAQLPDRDTLTTIAMIAKGRGHFLAGNLPEARRWLETALTTDGAGYSVWRISALGSLALLDAWCGRTRRAVESASEAFALAREMNNWHHPATAEAHLATSLASLERAEHEHAAAAWSEGRIRAHANGRDLLSWVAFAEFGAFGAFDDFRASDQVPGQPAGSPPPIVADFLLAKRSRDLRLHGSPDRAARLLNGDPVLTSSVLFEKAAAELTLGHLEAAQDLVRRFADVADALEPLARVRGLILASWCSATVGMDARADALLSEALELAEDDGLVAVFVQAGPVTIRRIANLTDGLSPLIHDAVLENVSDRVDVFETGELADRLVDRLTDRELELLTLLPTRLTNTELADRFVVSVNTIKTHMAHIYRKLDVVNRSDAIARAVHLGLLKQRWIPSGVPTSAGATPAGAGARRTMRS